MRRFVIILFTLVCLLILFGGNLNHFNKIKENPLKLILCLFLIAFLSFDLNVISKKSFFLFNNRKIIENASFSREVICVISTWFFSLGVFLDWRHTVLIEFPYINIIGWLVGNILYFIIHYIYRLDSLNATKQK